MKHKERPRNSQLPYGVLKQEKKSMGKLENWKNSVSSVAQLCPTLCDPWTAAHQASLSITSYKKACSLVNTMLMVICQC